MSVRQNVSNYVPKAIKRLIKNRLVESNLRKLKKSPRLPYDRVYLTGVNLIGAVRSETGLGQSCRLIAKELETAGIPYSIFNYDEKGIASSNDCRFDEKISEELPYAVNIVHVNPYDIGLLSVLVGRKIWDYRYNIAFWAWELEEFPDHWAKMEIYFDEIWTPSRFCTDSIQRKVHIPVFTMTYHIEVCPDLSYGRKRFGLPKHRFLYLVMYDCNSTIERKNVIGGIQAYKTAFPSEYENVGLIVKMNNAARADMRKLQESLQGYRNVYFLTKTLSKAAADQLLACSDVYISLHRAEGYGLVMAEAMLLGIPCVATNWSGNTDFMDATCACMVDYSFTEIKNDTGYYTKGSRWAEADVRQAAGYIVRLYEDREYYTRISDSGRKRIRGMSRNQDMRERLKKILYEKDIGDISLQDDDSQLDPKGPQGTV